MAKWVQNLLAMQETQKTQVGSPGGGHGNPFQYSCLKNPIDKSLVGYSP